MQSFRDLGVAELRRSAIEDFAVEIGEKDNKDTVIAALVEAGVSWDDYVAQHPEVAPEPTPEPADNPNNVVMSSDVAPTREVEEKPTIRVAEQPVSNPSDKFLIKMVRDNLLYETRGHRFTQQHPYALVSPADADYILRHEDGFRQAYPTELEEFYS